MKKILPKIITYARAHRVITATAVVIIALTGWTVWRRAYASVTPPRYVLVQAQKGTLIVSTSGTGQVSAENQVDLKPKAGGDIISVNVKSGQTVKAGMLIAQINATEAFKSVRDAETSLASAQLAYQKLIQPANHFSLLQTQHVLDQAKESKLSAEDNLVKTYQDGFNTVSDAFLELPDIMTGLYDILFSSSASGSGQWNIDFYPVTLALDLVSSEKFKHDASTKYGTAKKSFDENFSKYKNLTRLSSHDEIEKIIDQTYKDIVRIAEAVKSADNLIRFYQDNVALRNLTPVAASDAHLTDLISFTSKTNSRLLNLLNIRRTIQDSKESIINADRSIAEKTESLQNLENGPDQLDLASEKLSIKQRENALLDARQKLADYSMRAPFDGVIAQLDVKRGDSVSSGTTVGVLMTQQKIAEISLNEIDIAKIKIGQKVNLTFDAVSDLTISGQVSDVDTLSSSSQGVVTYDVKIGFDTQDERIKPVMCVSANIITDVKTDALLVPSSAVQSLGDVHMVQTVDASLASDPMALIQGVTLPAAPDQTIVKIGLSNDEQTEILSGLSENDVIVARTVQVTASTGTNRAPQQATFFGPAAGGVFRGSAGTSNVRIIR